MANNIGTLLVELGVNTAAFVEGMDKATYKAKQAGKEIGEAFKGLGKDLGGLLGQFGEIGSVIGESLGQAGETIAKMAGQFGSLGGAAGAAAIGISAVAAVAVAAGAGLSAMAVAGAEVVHELTLVSAKTGIGINDLLALKAAGATVGIGLDGMVTAFRKFDQALTGMGKGSSAAQITLKALGVTATSNKEALEQVAEAFKNMEDGPAKAADAVALFGRSGLNMIPFLNKGKEGLEEFNKMVDEYGPKIGKDAKEANENFLITQQKLGLAWDSMKVSIESAVLPALTKMIQFAADATKATQTLGSEIKNHFWESVKALASSGSIYGGIAQISVNAAVRGPSNEEKEQKAANEAKEKALAISGQQVKAEMEIFNGIKDGGQAAEKLRQTQETINELLAIARDHSDPAKVREAEALQRTIPMLERAAKLEKERRDYQLNPKSPVLGPDKVGELDAKTQEQVDKQRALAEATLLTTSATSQLAAELKAKAEVDALQRNLTNELSRSEQELKRMSAETGTQRYADAVAQRDHIKQELAELAAYKDRKIAMEREIAAATAINSAGEKTRASIEAFQDQIAVLDEVSDSYKRFGASQRDAQIAQMTSKEAIEVRKAAQAYDELVKSGNYTDEVLATYKKRLDATIDAEREAKSLAGTIFDKRDEQKVRDLRDALAAEAAAWNIEAEAIGKGTQAKIEAAVAAARLKAQLEGKSPAEQQLAGEQAGQKGVDDANKVLYEKRAAMDITAALKEKLDVLERIRNMKGTTHEESMMIDADEKKAIQESQKAWIDAAMAVGSFQERAAAGLQTLVLDGQDFWKKFEESGIQAISSVESELAKFAVTGKANFKQIAQTFEEGFIKNTLSAGISKASSGLLDHFGLGGLIPTKRDGSSQSAALYVMPVGGSMGDMGGGVSKIIQQAAPSAGGFGGGGALGLLGTIGSFFGLPFLADGGDVTPGRAYVVGEDHPEFFVPHTAGSVVPAMKIGGQQTNVNHFHFNGVQDMDSFKRSKDQVAQHLTSQIGRANGRK